MDLSLVTYYIFHLFFSCFYNFWEVYSNSKGRVVLPPTSVFKAFFFLFPCFSVWIRYADFVCFVCFWYLLVLVSTRLLRSVIRGWSLIWKYLGHYYFQYFFCSILYFLSFSYSNYAYAMTFKIVSPFLDV